VRVNKPEHRRAIEHLLEDESLTADLVDQAARILIEWVQTRAGAILQETEGAPEERRARLTALQRTGRRIARRVGKSRPDEQPAGLKTFLDACDAAPGGELDEP